jgi:hypothetical protein
MQAAVVKSSHTLAYLRTSHLPTLHINLPHVPTLAHHDHVPVETDIRHAQGGSPPRLPLLPCVGVGYGEGPAGVTRLSAVNPAMRAVWVRCDALPLWYGSVRGVALRCGTVRSVVCCKCVAVRRATGDDGGRCLAGWGEGWLRDALAFSRRYCVLLRCVCVCGCGLSWRRT